MSFPDNKRAIKLVLVMPPQLGLLRGFSTGLLALANHVSQCLPDVEVQILDLSETPWEEVKGELSRSICTMGKHLVVGLTTTTASYQSALEVARGFKWLDPACTVVFGGHHAGADAENVLRHHRDVVDFIIVGEGERALAGLLKNLRHPNQFLTPGLAFLHRENFYHNPGAPLLTYKELDDLPLTFQDGGLFGTPGKFHHVTYVSARGCPLKCAFCSVANEKIRAKSVPRVVEDIRELVGRGYRRIAIEDNFFAHSPARTRELCTALASLRAGGVQFSWDCQTRVESIARAGTIGLLEGAGCEAVYVGLESLNSDQLIYLNKTSHPQRYLEQLVKSVVPELLESSVDCYLNLQLGLPGETERHFERTFDYLQELGSMAVKRSKTLTVFPQLHVVYPGTFHFSAGVSEGRFARDVFESFTQWESQRSPIITWLGEHFAHGTGGLPEGILNPAKLRQSSYEVDIDSVLRVSSALKAMERIEGITVFKYGAHLVEKHKRVVQASVTLDKEDFVTA
jgi:radical SAM superfamily enzyme YgiQ (UPF0313 family)